MTDERHVLAETQTAGFGLANGKVVDRLLLAFDHETPKARIRRERVTHPDPIRDGEVRRQSRGTIVVDPRDTHHDRGKLEIGTNHGRDRVIAEWNDHAPRAYLRHERLEDGDWTRQAAWELHPVQGIEQVDGRSQSGDGELATDGGVDVERFVEHPNPDRFFMQIEPAEVEMEVHDHDEVTFKSQLVPGGSFGVELTASYTYAGRDCKQHLSLDRDAAESLHKRLGEVLEVDSRE